MTERKLTVPSEAAGLRLDYYLAQVLAGALSRAQIKTLVETGKVTLNAQAVKAHTHLASGDQVFIAYEEDAESLNRAEDIPLDVVYEDKDLLIVNKPAGMVVHPACGNPNGTLVNALLHYSKSLSRLGDASRPGIVHRLDKDTSGLIVVAKHDQAHVQLARQFQKHQIDRLYWAVVHGVVQHEEMRSRQPLGRAQDNRKKVVIQETGKPAVTHFRVAKRFRNATLIEARPETGRTHQIRVHLRALGYPVLGDLVYGIRSPWISRQALHAKALGFVHPGTHKRVYFDSELPADMKFLLNRLEN